MSATPKRSGYVAIIGRTNVGKSTLTNLLVGEKVAIVAEVPQTTRNRINGFVNLPGGQIVIVDTPGIHKPLHDMNRMMVAQATAAMRDVDLILFMIEATDTPPWLGPGDRFILGQLPRETPPVILVINKVDRIRNKEKLLPMIAGVKDQFPFREILLISAQTGQNTQDLAERLLPYLPEGEPLFPAEQFTDQQERFLAAELIREKILHHTRQEIPHETCVIIESWNEDREDLTKIEATVLVEKDSQRGILIGHEGSLMKTVGTEARADLENLLGRPVYLKLWVRVRGGWRDDDTVLKDLGIRVPD